MAASIFMMRNLCKLNGANLLKIPTKLRPSSCYATFAVRAPQPPNNYGSRPLIFFKSVRQQPERRGFSLTATTKKAAPNCGPTTAPAGHTFIWTFEKLLSATLLFTLPAAFMYPSQAMDALMAISLVLHSHWGIESVLVDYVRPNVVGNILPKLAHVLLFFMSVTTLGGLFYLIHNDIGIAESIKRLWEVKGSGGDGYRGGDDGALFGGSFGDNAGGSDNGGSSDNDGEKSNDNSNSNDNGKVSCNGDGDSSVKTE